MNVGTSFVPYVRPFPSGESANVPREMRWQENRLSRYQQPTNDLPRSKPVSYVCTADPDRPHNVYATASQDAETVLAVCHWQEETIIRPNGEELTRRYVETGICHNHAIEADSAAVRVLSLLYAKPKKSAAEKEADRKARKRANRRAEIRAARAERRGY